MSLISLREVTLTYGDALAGELAPLPTLREVNLEIAEGELVLVIGPTGSGKSTLLGLLGGQVPHFTGGHLSGEVEIDGRNLRTHRPRDLADVVGVVGQNPLAGFGHGHRGGGARIRHGADRAPRGDDAQASGGDPRSPRDRRAAARERA